jgi:hypothetical protein
VQCRFLFPVKIIASAGFEPTTLGSSGKHTDLYTTEAIKISVRFTSLVITDNSMEKIPLFSANQEISIATCNTGENFLEIFEFADVETSSAENCSVAQKYPTTQPQQCLLWVEEILHSTAVIKISPQESILGQLNPVCTFTTNLSKIQFSIIFHIYLGFL